MASNLIYNKTRYFGSTPRDFHFINGRNQEIGRAEQNGNVTWAEIMEWFSIVYPTLRWGTFRVHECLDRDPEDPLVRRGPAIDMPTSGNHLILPNTWYVILGPDGRYIRIETTTDIPAPRVPPLRYPNRDYRLHFFWQSVELRDGICVFSDPHVNQTLVPPQPGTRGWIPGRTVSCHIFPLELLEERGYKMTTFKTGDNILQNDGKGAIINTDCGQDDRVSDDLLYNHYRETVIINMTGRRNFDVIDFGTTESWSHMGIPSPSLHQKIAVELYFKKVFALGVSLKHLYGDDIDN
ncbi:hypothetical protein TWF696_004216 [Orbilia brochopaga]|uniref:Uncharacterized protein n=1 Tax=Orbilia brochopaga TaxID=3140254 RepID=A0AAV9V8M0_9PEZI